MCEYCNRRIHAANCPNAIAEEIDYSCDYCKEEIERGESFIDNGEKAFHKSCFFDFIFSINEDDFLDMFCLETIIAGEE